MLNATLELDQSSVDLFGKRMGLVINILAEDVGALTASLDL